jgi:hypothetical protein
MAEDILPDSSDKMYREIIVESVEDLLHLYDKLAQYVFRGQTRASKKWTLKTTFERAGKGISKKDWTALEQKVLLEFRRRAQHYLLDLPEPQQHLEWLALMQHHGCSTRLLDFTRSFFIALFFAIENSDSHAAVWAVDSTYYESRPGIPRWKDHLHSTYNKDAEKKANDILSSSDKKHDKGILLVEPFRMNERLSLQHGIFLFPKNIEVSFEENFCSHHGVNSFAKLAQKEGKLVVAKIVIPKMLHLKIACLLDMMNISATTLFPGLDGFARSQKRYIQSTLSHEEYRKDILDTLTKKILGR